MSHFFHRLIIRHGIDPLTQGASILLIIWLNIYPVCGGHMGTARFVTNYKLCIFIFWCRAMQASKHTAYTSIESQMIGRSSWAKYAAFRSATMVGMSDIEIPISYVWRVTPQIYMHTQPSVEISWYSIYTFLLLESCCYWVNENTADRFQGKIPGCGGRVCLVSCSTYQHATFTCEPILN